MTAKTKTPKPSRLTIEMLATAEEMRALGIMAEDNAVSLVPSEVEVTAQQLAYKAAHRAKRFAVLAEMVAQDQKLGLLGMDDRKTPR